MNRLFRVLAALAFVPTPLVAQTWSPWEPKAGLPAGGAGSVQEDGVTMFFHDVLDVLIYVAHRDSRDSPWVVKGPVPELNDPLVWNHTARVSPDGRSIFIHRAPPGGGGNTDIWFYHRPSKSDTWSSPWPVTELNSGKHDVAAQATADGLYVVFSSDRQGTHRFKLY